VIWFKVTVFSAPVDLVVYSEVFRRLAGASLALLRLLHASALGPR
jgi:hypothetical protein